MSAVITSRSMPSRGTKYTFWRGAFDEDWLPPVGSRLDAILVLEVAVRGRKWRWGVFFKGMKNKKEV